MGCEQAFFVTGYGTLLQVRLPRLMEPSREDNGEIPTDAGSAHYGGRGEVGFLSAYAS